jgi:hypothetical protein
VKQVDPIKNGVIMTVLRSKDAVNGKKGGATMSPAGASAAARGVRPTLRIKLRETGGISGLQRTVALDGNTLRVLDRGQLRIQKELPVGIVQAFANRVKALEDIQPKRNYGRYRFTSDILTTALVIRDDANDIEVEVVSDPSDPAPFQFWEIVNNLQELSSLDVHTTTPFDY